MNNAYFKFIVALHCFVSLSSLNAYAANPCQIITDGGIGGTSHMLEEGIGGTGYTPSDGIGGTGKHFDNGIGGTGKPVSNGTGGIGGTGSRLAVIGVVTGFASICVNGVELHYDNNTAININGETANSAQLAVGQLVSVSAEKSPKGWNAVNIQSSDAVSGPLTKFTAPNRAEIAGQTVLLPKEKIDPNINKFAIGQHIRVQGVRMTNGEILASSVARATTKEIIITGPVVRDANGDMGIGKIKLGNLSPKFAENGQQVSVTGRLNGNTLNVTTARIALQVDARANYLSIQSGLATASNDQLLLTNGTKIQTNRAIKSGSLLQINAYKDKNGSWQSISISDQTHADLMKRAGKTEDNLGNSNNKSDDNNEDKKDKDNKDEDKSSSGSSQRDDDSSSSNSGSSNSGSSNSGSSNSGSSNSGSSNSGSSNSGSSNSGSSNSGSSNSGSSNSGSSSKRLNNDNSAQNRSTGTNEAIKVEKVEVQKVEKVEKVERVEKVEKVERVEKVEKVEKVERVERPRSSDRISADERGGSGKGRNK